MGIRATTAVLLTGASLAGCAPLEKNTYRYELGVACNNPDDNVVLGNLAERADPKLLEQADALGRTALIPIGCENSKTREYTQPTHLRLTSPDVEYRGNELGAYPSRPGGYNGVIDLFVKRSGVPVYKRDILRIKQYKTWTIAIRGADTYSARVQQVQE